MAVVMVGLVVVVVAVVAVEVVERVVECQLPADSSGEVPPSRGEGERPFVIYTSIHSYIHTFINYIY